MPIIKSLSSSLFFALVCVITKDVRYANVKNIPYVPIVKPKMLKVVGILICIIFSLLTKIATENVFDTLSVATFAYM